MYDTKSNSVLKSEKFLHGMICIIRFDDSNIFPCDLVYLNSLLSISTKRAMREELETAAIIIAIILKKENAKG